MVEHKNLKVAYFGSWGTYKVPLVPQEPITEGEAKQRKTFYKAYYNQKEQLISFEKYMDGELTWKDKYIYRDNGKLKKRYMIKSDGFKTIQQFDRKGRIIQ